MSSTTFTSAAALQDYIRDFNPELLTKLYTKFRTAELMTPHDSVKDQLVLTENIMGTMIQKWSKTFDPKANVIDFKPRTVRTKPWKVDLQIHPQEFESTYLGMARQTGFKVDDLPFEAFLLQRLLEKVAAEQEIAAWQGVELGSPADGAPLTDLVNGLLTIITTELALNNSNFTAVSTSAHSTSNAVTNAEAVHAGLAPEYQAEETYLFCSFAFARLYFKNYRTDFTSHYGVVKQGAFDMIKLDFGNCWMVPIVGMGTSSRLVVTPKANLHYLFDGQSDATTITVEKNHRAFDFMIDAKSGFDFGIVHNDILRVNNLT